MKVGELKELLDAYDDELDVHIVHQPNYPLECTIGEITSQHEYNESLEDGNSDPNQEPNVVFITEGSSVGYGPRLWG